MKNREDELGALWERQSSSGNKYWTGKITLNDVIIDIVVFENTGRQPGDKKPSHRIYRSVPLSRPKDTLPTAAKPGLSPEAVRALMGAQTPSLEKELNDDVPF